MNKEYMFCKLYNTKKWCIRPVDWEGVWTDDWQLKHGNYIALFDNEHDALDVCRQLNISIELEKKFNEMKDILKEEEILDKDNKLNTYLMNTYTLNDIKKFFEIL